MATTLLALLGPDGTAPTNSGLAAFAAAVAADGSVLAGLGKTDALVFASKTIKLINAKCGASQFAGLTLARFLATKAGDQMFTDHALVWANAVLNGPVKKSSGPLFDEALLTLRCIIVRSKQFAHLQRDVATPTIQKLFVLLLQKAHTLAEFTVIGSSFPSITKPYAEKLETLAIQTLGTQDLFPKLYTHAVKALVVSNRILTAAAAKQRNDNASSAKVSSVSTAGRISETLATIVKDILSVVNFKDLQYPSKSQAYQLSEIDGSYSARLVPLVERFKAFIQCHLYLLGSKGDKADSINPKTILVIASLILGVAGNEKAKNGQHEAIYAEKLQVFMPVLVSHINRLLGALVLSLGLQLISDRDTLWFLIRKSFAYSAKFPALRISAYRLISSFIETFGTNGVDSVYLGIVDDVVGDVASLKNANAGRNEAALVVAASKCLSSILTYATPQQIPLGPITALFTMVIQNILSISTGKATSAFGNSIKLALFTLLVKCLQCHGRDSFPFEWVASGMKSLLNALARADSELKPKLEALINSHSDVLFGYRPAFGKSAAAGAGAASSSSNDVDYHGSSSFGYSGQISITGNSGGFMDFISSSRRDNAGASAAAMVVDPPVVASDVKVSVSGTTQRSRGASPVRLSGEVSTNSPARATSPVRSSVVSQPAPVRQPTAPVNNGSSSASKAAPVSVVKPVIGFTRANDEDQDEMDVDEEKETVKQQHSFVMPDEDDGEIELPDIVFDEEEDEDDDEEEVGEKVKEEEDGQDD
ncbi:UNVERIFIED_CONTAM: hypothetical protein HDU68_012480 [Siphonaria sp. JEL0065]|nr:hypothetical protein HDU68_012480 [Siphonaria sp. JEL0065]